MLFDYANVLVFVALGIALCALMLGLGALLRPANPERTKLTTYECGELVTGDSWINFNIRFYLVALVFIVFDVEVALIYPVVTVFSRWVEAGQGALALGEMLAFIAILVAGLAYVWRKGDLRWIKTVAEPPRELEDRVGGPGR
ncbi:MAG: NADH-quinone oxidoreductase subunit A [Candidatus Dadabacteria bacterium]|nr:MAG: NADH-quinone oxidoreductase subunit A [Candidatus Dadabacteria bacterium]